MGKGGEATSVVSAPRVNPPGTPVPKIADLQQPTQVPLLTYCLRVVAGCIPLAVFFIYRMPMWMLPLGWAILAEMLAYVWEIGVPQVKLPVKQYGKKAEFTWEEVARHNNKTSAWVSIGAKVYDITDWLDKHPGGRSHLLLAAGRDITDLYKSYHPLTNLPDKYLAAYEIGTLVSLEHPQYKPDTGFYKECCEKIADYFKKTGKNSKDPVAGLLRMIPVFTVAALCYYFVNVVDEISLPAKLFLAAIYGICQALPLLHVMHDASHTACGVNETWWTVVGRFCMDWYAGASLTSWHNQHVVGHHIYTNVFGSDPDLPVSISGDIRRLVSTQLWANFYKFQHLYMPIAYGLLGLKFRVQDVTGTFLGRVNGPMRVNPIESHVWLRQIASKSFFVFWRIMLPLYVFNADVATFWLCFFVAELGTGYWLAFNFQVSHISTVADFPEKANDIDDEWAVSQVKSSVDYSHGDSVMTFLCGALNYQVTHHLFPSISQYHYPAIAPIIQEVAKKYKVEYTYVKDFPQAFHLHIQHLYELGQAGKAAHMD
eukprot:GFYU01002542.1.p1 GENE.GFYU01002542.1~~GFYU01002542.1.p1  ORF type:complete len:541 (+),score=179.67 GFYU01002542.1:233-1855(+)